MLPIVYANALDEPKHCFRLEEIYHQYRVQMLRVAGKVLSDHHAAEDAVHDAFLGIARNMHTVARLREDEVRHYVLRAAQNAALHLLRDQRGMELSMEEVAPVSDEDFVDLLCSKEDVEEVMCAMKELPVIYRDALYYRYVMELSAQETAALLSVRIDTMRKRLARGRELLAQRLREKGWGDNG